MLQFEAKPPANVLQIAKTGAVLTLDFGYFADVHNQVSIVADFSQSGKEPIPVYGPLARSHLAPPGPPLQDGPDLDLYIVGQWIRLVGSQDLVDALRGLFCKGFRPLSSPGVMHRLVE